MNSIDLIIDCQNEKDEKMNKVYQIALQTHIHVYLSTNSND
jgi:hypothetical protein